MCFLNYNYFIYFKPQFKPRFIQKACPLPKGRTNLLVLWVFRPKLRVKPYLGLHIFLGGDKRHITLQLVCYSNNTMGEDAILNNIICKTGQSARKLGNLSASGLATPGGCLKSMQLHKKILHTSLSIYFYDREDWRCW